MTLSKIKNPKCFGCQLNGWGRYHRYLNLLVLCILEHPGITFHSFFLSVPCPPVSWAQRRCRATPQDGVLPWVDVWSHGRNTPPNLAGCSQQVHILWHMLEDLSPRAEVRGKYLPRISGEDNGFTQQCKQSFRWQDTIHHFRDSDLTSTNVR